MTNSSPPNPPDSSSQKPNPSGRIFQKNIMDEWIAVLTAFAVIGTIIFSSFGGKSLNWENLLSKVERGFFSFSEDTEYNNDLNLEQDSDLEPRETARSTEPPKAFRPIPVPDVTRVKDKDSKSLDFSPRKIRTKQELERDLRSSVISNGAISGIIVPKTESEIGDITPEPPVIAETETPEITPEPPIIAETETPEITPEPPVIPKADQRSDQAPSSDNGVISDSEKSQLVFEDVPKVHWAYPFIQTLGKRNFIIAHSDNNFEPDQPITRAGMADLISHAFKDNPEKFSTKNFKDVSPDNQRFADINQAVKIGFMKGYSNQEFRPEKEIPRYQVFVTLATGLGLNPDGNPDNILSKFRDRNQIPDWAKEQVAAAIQSNLIINRPGFDFRSLEPNKPATRAEVAAMIYQALVQYDKVDSIESTYIVPYP